MSEALAAAAPAVAEAPAESQELDTKEPNFADPTAKPVVAPPVKKAEPVSTKKKYKLKVDSREEDFEFDPSNDEEVIKHLQMSKASQNRMREASEIKKAAMDFIEQLRKDPRKVLSDPSIGVDVKKFAENILNEQIAEMEKTPEQREKEAAQAKLKEYEEKYKKLEEDNKTAKFERMQAEQEKQLTEDISAALDIGGIPKTPRTVARMAEMMMIALDQGIDLSARDIAPLVKNNTLSEFKEVVSALSDDQLEDFLGKEVLGRLRKKNVAKAKAPETANQVKSVGQLKPKEEKPAEKITIRKFFGV